MDKLSDRALLKIFVTEDYVNWLKSMSKYAPAVPIGILAQMQPSKTYESVDYKLDALCSRFNSATMLQKSLLGDKYFKSYLVVFFQKAATWYFRSTDQPIVNVKTLAASLGVSNNTIYEMAHKFVLISYNSAVSSIALGDKVQSMLKDDNFKF